MPGVPEDEGRGRDAERLQMALEVVLVVERGGGQRIVPDVGHPEHFQHGRRMRDRAQPLHSARVQPGDVHALFHEAAAKLHVVGKYGDVAAAQTPHRAGDVARDALVALPRPRIAGLMDDGLIGPLVAAVDHREAKTRQKLRQLGLQAIDSPRRGTKNRQCSWRCLKTCHPTKHDATLCTHNLPVSAR